MSVDSRGTTADASSDLPEMGTGFPQWGRAGSAVLGGTLLVLGLRRRSLGGTVLAIVGGWLCYEALGGDARSSQMGGSDAAAGRDGHESEAVADSPTVERSVIVGRPADELSELARDPETLGRIVGRFADVESTDEDRHRWSVRGPLDRTFSWETRLVEEQSDERLRWEPVDGPAVFEEWSMEFGPALGDRGTEVTLRIRFDPPGGTLASRGIERLDVVPGTLVRETLDRFKSLAETGQVPTLEGNPSARGEGDLL